MSTLGWIILIAANIPLYWFVGWIVFRDWGEFWECIKYSLTPDIVSLFRGEWAEDRWAQMKLAFSVFVCAAAVYSEGQVLAKWLH